MADPLTTERGCTIRVGHLRGFTPGMAAHLRPGLMLVMHMDQPGDQRYAETALTYPEARALLAVLAEALTETEGL